MPLNRHNVTTRVKWGLLPFRKRHSFPLVTFQKCAETRMKYGLLRCDALWRERPGKGILEGGQIIGFRSAIAVQAERAASS